MHLTHADTRANRVTSHGFYATAGFIPEEIGDLECLKEVDFRINKIKGKKLYVPVLLHFQGTAGTLTMHCILYLICNT
jgi:hypothetical protein